MQEEQAKQPRRFQRGDVFRIGKHWGVASKVGDFSRGYAEVKWGSGASVTREWREQWEFDAQSECWR